MVAVGSSLLLAPVLWDHYLALVVLPAALLAARGRSWGLALPLLTWLPAVLLPLVALLAVALPFWAPGRRPGHGPSATLIHPQTRGLPVTTTSP